MHLPYPLFFLPFPLLQWDLMFWGSYSFNSSNIDSVLSINKAHSLAQGVKKWTTETLVPTVVSPAGALEVPMGHGKPQPTGSVRPLPTSGDLLSQFAQGWKSFLGPRAKIRKVLGTLPEESLVAFVLTPSSPHALTKCPCTYYIVLSNPLESA